MYEGNIYYRPDCFVKKSGEVEERPEESGDTVLIGIGETKQLTTKLTQGEVQWISTDDSVVEVKNGTIIGIARGEAKVIISYKQETSEEGTGSTEETEKVPETQTYTIIVEGGIPQSFTLGLQDINLTEYQTVNIGATIDGKRVATSYIDWEISDAEKAKIDRNGNITGLEIGTATVTCKWKNDTNITATCTVTVGASKTLVLDKTDLKLTPNQNATINARFNGTNVTKTAIWRSEDESIATVSNGVITVVGVGNTTIVAEKDGQTAICRVQVRELVSEIYTVEDLNLFAIQVNSGNKFEGLTVTLMNDIDFKDVKTYESTGSDEYKKYYTNYQNGIYNSDTSWPVIGNTITLYFSGTFEGNNYKIDNLYVNKTERYAGLFGYILNGRISNLKITNANVTSTSHDVGTLAGGINNTELNNIYTSGTVSATGRVSSSDSTERVGGIIGVAGRKGVSIVTNCVNEANVTGKYNQVGGIAGYVYKGTVIDSINKGNIKGEGADIGGICGYLGYSDSATCIGNIDNCANYGEINGTTVSSYNVGGIVGVVTQSSTVKNSINYNSGKVCNIGKDEKNYSYAGGIVGHLGSFGTQKVDNCKNYAEVISTYSNCGGICGLSKKGDITNCYNSGKISDSAGFCGGIVGALGTENTTLGYKTSSVYNCVNDGTVTAKLIVGGISGSLGYLSTIDKCINNGSINSIGNDSTDKTNIHYNVSSVGGILGQTGHNDRHTIKNCINNGNVNGGKNQVGGIIGWLRNGIISNCTNNGQITGSLGQVGGCVGGTGINGTYYSSDTKIQASGQIEKCVNNGSIEGIGNASNFGGICGVLYYNSTITLSINKASVKSNGKNSSSASNTGGIVGGVSDGKAQISYCYNTGAITGTYNKIGGIAGKTGTGNTINYCYSKGIITGPAAIGGIVGANSAKVTDSYYLKNTVNPTSGSETIINSNDEQEESVINNYIKDITW